MHTKGMHVVWNVCQHYKSFFSLVGCYVDDRQVFTLPYICNICSILVYVNANFLTSQ